MKVHPHCIILPLLLAGTWLPTHAHNLGLHNLSGDNPSGDPLLPAIRGAFEVVLKVRFNPIADELFHHIFEYSVLGSDADTVFFGHTPSGNFPGAVLVVIADGTTNLCFGPSILTLDTLYTFKFGVEATGTARIYLDGAMIAECAANTVVPRDVPRNHYLKTGFFSNIFINTAPMAGAILGLQVKNLDGVTQHPRDTYALMNFPSQTFGYPFVASFYARFDDISDPTVNSQRVFDFGNGEANNNIICGQRDNTNSLACEVFSGAVMQEVVVPNGIVEGEFAFWHFGLEQNGSMWIEKDGVQVAQVTGSFQPVDVFRSQLLFGKSAWPQDGNLNGVVLGFRLDGDIVS